MLGKGLELYPNFRSFSGRNLSGEFSEPVLGFNSEVNESRGSCSDLLGDLAGLQTVPGTSDGSTDDRKPV